LAQNPVDLLYVPIVGYEPGVVAARVAGIRCIAGTFHLDSQHGSWYERPMEWITNHALGCAIAVSEVIGQDWIARSGIPPGRVVAIHNGIDPDQFQRSSNRADARQQLGLPPDGPIVVGVGCLRGDLKGFGYLIEALAILRHEFPKAVVALAGEGPLQAELEARSQVLGVADRVVFLGFRSDVNHVYDAADVFVLSSLSEALPYVVLEAMAHELPVVGTRVGGVPEVIVQEETGFLVPPRDSAAIAESLRRLLASVELRQRMGKAGRERVVRHFREDEMVRKTLEVYRSALARKLRTVRA
jgi:glycosyltransferase involved in cell wall biosynthesis